MTRKQFLKLLEEKLNVLDEQERQDILNEYEATIDEKVKAGKTVKEAINDFGDIDELASETLKAYRINPDYNKNEDKIEKTIKSAANKLADGTKKVVEEIKSSDNDITIEFIFEILIKVLLFLIGIAILRIPFWLLESLGTWLLDILFEPLNIVLIGIWKLIIWLMYVAASVLLGIKMFSTYIKKPNEVKKVNTEEKEEKPKKKENNPVVTILLTILKIFVVFVLVIPIGLSLFGMLIALIFSIYFVIKGIPALGLVLLLLGLIIIGYNLLHIIVNPLFNKKRVYFFPAVIGTIIFGVGCVMLIDTTINFNYVDNLPVIEYEKTKEVYKDFMTVDDLDIYVQSGNKEFIINNELEDNEYQIEVSYYKEFISVERYDLNNGNLEFHRNSINLNKEMRKNLHNLIIDNLKDETLYNYEKLFEIEVKIYANDKTIKKID